MENSARIIAAEANFWQIMALQQQRPHQMFYALIRQVNDQRWEVMLEGQSYQPHDDNPQEPAPEEEQPPDFGQQQH